jgi:hypothetical protein
MHQKTKEKILKDIIQLAENKRNPSECGVGVSKVVISEGIGFALDDKLALLFYDISKKFVQDDIWGKKFSEKYVNNKLDNMLIKIIRDGNSANAMNYLEEFIEELDNYSAELIVYVPLDGIEMPIQKMQIGKVILKNMNDEEITELTTKIEQIVLSSKNTPTEKEYYIKHENENINKYIRRNICAEVRIIAEPDKAHEMAEDEARRVIDLFRYAAPAIYGSSLKVAIGIKGDINSTIRHIPIISSGSGGYYPRSYRAGAIGDFVLSPKNIESLTQLGVFKVSEILSKPDEDISNYEQTLLKGIHWFSSSQIQQDLENKLLNLITCLEALLTPDDGNPIGTAIAEGVAFIVADDVEKRTRIKKSVKHLYNKRSAISHGGQKVVLESDLSELQQIAGTLIMILIDRKDEFNSKKNLLDWIEAKKFS